MTDCTRCNKDCSLNKKKTLLCLSTHYQLTCRKCKTTIETSDYNTHKCIDLINTSDKPTTNISQSQYNELSLRVSIYEQIIKDKLGIYFNTNTVCSKDEFCSIVTNYFKLETSSTKKRTNKHTESKHTESKCNETKENKDVETPILTNVKKTKDTQPYDKEQLRSIILQTLNQLTVRDISLTSTKIKKLKQDRLKFMELCEYDEYITFIKTMVSILTNILTKTERNPLVNKTIRSNILICLCGIESRILEQPKFTTLELNVSEITTSNKIYLQYIKPNKHIFNVSYIRICNYNLILCKIDDIFASLFSTGIVRKSDGGSHLYYTLTTECDAQRKWKLASRLEDLANEFATNVSTYLIMLFRKIYHDIYNDYTFREEIITKLSTELLSILKYLHYFSKQIEFAKKIGMYVPVYKETDEFKDVFDSEFDDYMQQERFNKGDEIDKFDEYVVALFDNLTSDQAKKINLITV